MSLCVRVPCICVGDVGIRVCLCVYTMYLCVCVFVYMHVAVSVSVCVYTACKGLWSYMYNSSIEKGRLQRTYI